MVNILKFHKVLRIKSKIECEGHVIKTRNVLTFRGDFYFTFRGDFYFTLGETVSKGTYRTLRA